ncbi:MAG TPA: SCP2 sterol-binding domain-containing protein [Gemmatimonadales bacterium]|nr:SCP2 sterol-binding domain-containing protein [Gemmatimonadales bacterium]
MEAFSEDWARTWCQALNSDPAFRDAAATWAGDVTLVMTQSAAPQAPQKAVRVEIHHGQCLTAKPAEEGDLTEASYVVTATGAVWKELLAGRQSPLTALMTGKLRLTRGSLVALLPYAAMARELIRLAVEMNASIPGGWG